MLRLAFSRVGAGTIGRPAAIFSTYSIRPTRNSSRLISACFFASAPSPRLGAMGWNFRVVVSQHSL
jgi:hypothetical protein